MPSLAPHLTFIHDPGHGWLRVPLAEIARLGIEAEISHYSFIDGAYAYLEEDCDYGRYIIARQEQAYDLPKIRSRYVERFNRGLPRFGDAQFSAAFWARLRRQP